jgi:hypothetical protein
MALSASPLGPDRSLPKVDVRSASQTRMATAKRRATVAIKTMSIVMLGL